LTRENAARYDALQRKGWLKNVGKLVNAHEAGALTGKNERDVRRALAAGTLKGKKRGHTWEIDTDDLGQVWPLVTVPQTLEQHLEYLKKQCAETVAQQNRLQQQYDQLAGRVKRLETVMEQHQERFEAFEGRVLGLEVWAESRGLGRFKAVGRPEPVALAGTWGIDSTQAAKIVAERHGVVYERIRLAGWNQGKALENEETAVRWALEWAMQDTARRGPNFRFRCDVPTCGCRSLPSMMGDRH
jgi:hypothetical protein